MSREARKQNVKEKIVRSAIELFKQKGYDRVTVEEIACQSGIAKGTFFNYFPKKEHVLLHLADSYMGLMGDIVQRHREGALKDRVLHVFQDLVAMYWRHAELLRLALAETMKAAVESPEGGANLALLQEALTDMIQEAKDDGSLRSRWDAGLCASVLSGIFVHTLIRHASSMNEAEIVETLRGQLELVWEGLADA